MLTIIPDTQVLGEILKIVPYQIEGHGVNGDWDTVSTAGRPGQSARLWLQLPSPLLLAAVTLAFAIPAAVLIDSYGTNTPIWVSNAVAAVALLHQPVRTWLAFLLAIGLADAAVVASVGQGPPLLLALCDIGEIALTAGLVRFGAGFSRSPIWANKLARLVVACAVVPLLSSAAGAALLWGSESAPFREGWRIWYSASALGLLLIAPCLLCWSDPTLRRQELAGTRWHSMLLPAALTVAVAWTVFSSQLPILLFLTFPLLLLVGWRRGLLGATSASLVICAVGMWFTLRGEGPIARMVLPLTSTVDRVQGLQLYVGALLLCILPMVIIITRLRQSSEARTEFLAAMSHEIRTPLTGVLGMVDLMGAEQLTARQRGYLEAMHSSGRHLLNIINDILDFVRTESGHLELESVDFSLTAMLARMRALMAPAAVERGVAFRIEVEPGTPDVFQGDPVRLKQVLLNLVSNAIKFTAVGSIDVRVWHTAPERSRRRIVHFEVSDTGIGMQPEEVRRLFTPFMQADRSIARRYGGTGLGLAISKRLIEAMRGAIHVESTYGQGSVFHFEVALRLGNPANLVSSASTQQVHMAPRRILIAEDVAINRDILRTALSQQGHELVFAENGVEALALVERQEFDLVFMDVQMPVMDGVEATQRIRALPSPRRFLPIIGLTANVMAHERDRYLAAGMDDCLTKPIDWDYLTAAIMKYGGAAKRDHPKTVREESPPRCIDEARFRKLPGSPEEVRLLVTSAMECYQGYYHAIAAADAGAEVRRKEAHKLKGSAGTLGLAEVAELAERIEVAADEPAQLAVLIPRLQEALERARQELVRRGAIPQGSRDEAEPGVTAGVATRPSTGRTSSG